MRRLARLVAPSAGEERGSLVVALAVAMVLVLVSVAVVARVVGNQSIVVYRQNSSGGLAGADAALADALFHLDQLTSGGSSGDYFYVSNTSGCSSDPVHCVAQSVPGAAGVSYLATEAGPTKWTIKALGRVHGAPGAVQDTVTRAPQFQFALFGNTGLNFNGNASGSGADPDSFGSYDPGSTSSSTNPDVNPGDCVGGTGTSCVSVGSNGTINCNGSLGSNVTSVYYTGGGGISGSCGNTQAVTTLYSLPPPELSSTVAYNPCPNGGSFGSNTAIAPGSTVPGVNAPLASGSYLCSDTEVRIDGRVTVSGPVKIYVMLDSSTNTSLVNSGTPTLYIAGGSEVNTTFDGTAGTPAGVTLPDAENLEILSNSTGTVGNSIGNGAYTYGGIIYAPRASLTGDGCKSTYYGSLTINTLTCNGGPHLKVYYDSQLSTLYGPWETSGFAQINPGSVSIP